MFSLTHRPLTRPEAERVHEALKETPNILGYTVPELLLWSDVLVAEADGIFAGMCFSVDLAQNWTEIAALLVLPQCRGRGIGAALLAAAWDRAWGRGRHIYVLSRNPQVIEWMRARGMEVAKTGWRTPAAVQGYMARHMASRYRWAESFRKRKAIARCPPLMQGIKKQGIKKPGPLSDRAFPLRQQQPHGATASSRPAAPFARLP